MTCIQNVPQRGSLLWTFHQAIIKVGSTMFTPFNLHPMLYNYSQFIFFREKKQEKKSCTSLWMFRQALRSCHLSVYLICQLACQHYHRASFCVSFFGVTLTFSWFSFIISRRDWSKVLLTRASTIGFNSSSKSKSCKK